ncbi:MAG: hypothetical protein HPY52_01480 [Firmicutes bacterium]|nr:hypothetical protein [Bacillota bacterium]
MQDTRIGSQAIHLYLLIEQMRPDSLSELSRISGISRDSVREQCKILVETGWLVSNVKHGRKILSTTMPSQTQEAFARRLKEDREDTKYVGEFLMKKWLDVLVDSDDFLDNARPPFLTSPSTAQQLEYDRYYRKGVAFEYNGRQHYETTPQFPHEDALQEGRLRDHIKVSLSQKNGIALVQITEDDLNLENMRAKIPDRLRLRMIHKDGPYIRMLTRLSEEYVANCRRARLREQKGKNGG